MEPQDGPVRIIVETDGALSVIPGAAHRIPVLIIERRTPDGQTLRTIHCHPAEIYRDGMRFYVRRPTRPGWAAHTVVVDAEAAGATVDATTLHGLPAVLLTFEG